MAGHPASRPLDTAPALSFHRGAGAAPGAYRRLSVRVRRAGGLRAVALMANDLPDWAIQIIRPDDVPAGSPWTYGSAGGTKNFTIAKGSHILCVMVSDFTHVSEILMTGGTSTVEYLRARPFTSIVPRPYYAIVTSAVDVSVTLTVTASQAGTIYLANVHDPVAVAIAQQEAQPWQAPNIPPAPLSFGYPGAAASSIVIPAPAAPLSVWLHSLSYRWNTVTANTFGIWQTTGGLEIIADPGANDLTQRPYEFHGAKLPVAVGLEFTGQGAAAASSAFIQGSVAYAVY